MPRPPRILFNGAVYHIYQRRNNKDFIFENSKHKSFFIKQLRDYNRKFDYQLLAYVIMNNHYHLLMKTNNDTVDNIMFYINNVTSKFLSRELKQTGHIYENRYKCKLVETDAYLIWLLRYIHRNPIRAGICDNLKDYKWCSHIFYRYNISTFIDIDYILSIISTNRTQAIKQYLNLIGMSGCDDNIEADFEIIKNNYNLKETSYYENNKNNTTSHRLTLDDILNSIDASENTKRLIKESCKDRILIPYKIEFLKAALYNKYTLVEISQFLNTKSDALRKFKDYHEIV